MPASISQPLEWNLLDPSCSTASELEAYLKALGDLDNQPVEVSSMAPEIWEVLLEPDDESCILPLSSSSSSSHSLNLSIPSVPLPSSSSSSLSSSPYSLSSAALVSPRTIAQDRNLGENIAAKKQPVKLSRQQERDHDIVRAAVEATSKQAMSTSRKRSYSTHAKDSQFTPTPAPPKKPNAFSKMMAASKKKVEWTPAAADSRPWTHVFEQALSNAEAEGSFRYMGEHQWASAVSQSIIKSVQCMIMPNVFLQAPTQSKLNALHALIEIATATAYAPQIVASNLVRMGRGPRFLIDKMFKVTEYMSDVDMKRVISEKAFVDKVRELRQQPRILWEEDTWNGLDDLLRLFKDPGPVDFRRIYQRIDENMNETYGRCKSVKWIMQIIQKDISDYLNGDTCFEARYNAMNVLVDITMVVAKHHYGYNEYSDEPRLFNEALSTTLLKIGKSLDVSETDQILADMNAQEPMAFATLFQDMQALLDQDLLDMRNLNTHEQTILMHKTLNSLERHIDERKDKKNRDYCKDGLIAKMMRLRLKTHYSDCNWESSWDNLDDTIALFVDSSIPMKFDHYLRKIDSTVVAMPFYSCYNSLEQTKKIRHCFEHTITRILVRASGRACWETKLNAIKILAKIGLYILELFSPARPQWQNELFADHISEDMLTDAMLTISYSLAKTDGANLLTDEDLMDDMMELDSRRSNIPEAMDGLDGVLSVIQDPESLGSKASKRAKVAAISKTTHVIDLTDD
jgi:hypothetical protein